MYGSLLGSCKWLVAQPKLKVRVLWDCYSSVLSYFLHILPRSGESHGSQYILVFKSVIYTNLDKIPFLCLPPWPVPFSSSTSTFKEEKKTQQNHHFQRD